MQSQTIIDTASPRYGFDPKIPFAATLAGANKRRDTTVAATRGRRDDQAKPQNAPLQCLHPSTRCSPGVYAHGNGNRNAYSYRGTEVDSLTTAPSHAGASAVALRAPNDLAIDD